MWEGAYPIISAMKRHLTKTYLLIWLWCHGYAKSTSALSLVAVISLPYIYIMIGFIRVHVAYFEDRDSREFRSIYFDCIMTFFKSFSSWEQINLFSVLFWFLSCRFHDFKQFIFTSHNLHRWSILELFEYSRILMNFTVFSTSKINLYFL